MNLLHDFALLCFYLGVVAAYFLIGLCFACIFGLCADYSKGEQIMTFKTWLKRLLARRSRPLPAPDPRAVVYNNPKSQSSGKVK